MVTGPLACNGHGFTDVGHVHLDAGGGRIHKGFGMILEYPWILEILL